MSQNHNQETSHNEHVACIHVGGKPVVWLSPRVHSDIVNSLQRSIWHVGMLVGPFPQFAPRWPRTVIDPRDNIWKAYLNSLTSRNAIDYNAFPKVFLNSLFIGPGSRYCSIGLFLMLKEHAKEIFENAKSNNDTKVEVRIGNNLFELLLLWVRYLNNQEEDDENLASDFAIVAVADIRLWLLHHYPSTLPALVGIAQKSTDVARFLKQDWQDLEAFDDIEEFDIPDSFYYSVRNMTTANVLECLGELYNEDGKKGAIAWQPTENKFRVVALDYENDVEEVMFEEDDSPVLAGLTDDRVLHNRAYQTFLTIKKETSLFSHAIYFASLPRYDMWEHQKPAERPASVFAPSYIRTYVWKIMQAGFRTP